MTTIKKIAIVIISVLIVATLFFIWGNSFASKTQSAQESQTVYETVKPVLDAVAGKDKVTHNDFRKLTHACEFLALGVEICALFFVLFGFKIRKFFSIMPFGLFVAVTDESIQILSNRGPAVLDVLIDYSGYFTSCLIYLVISIILYYKRKNKTKNQI